MNLPTPTPEQVAEFRELWRQEFGTPLDENDAYDQCTRLFRYLFITRHALPYLRSQKLRK